MPLAHIREQKDQFFKNHPQSPLTLEQRQFFTGLRYFPSNADLRMTISVEVFSEQTPVVMQTSTGDTATYVRYGRIHFAMGRRRD